MCPFLFYFVFKEEILYSNLKQITPHFINMLKSHDRHNICRQYPNSTILSLWLYLVFLLLETQLWPVLYSICRFDFIAPFNEQGLSVSYMSCLSPPTMHIASTIAHKRSSITMVTIWRCHPSTVTRDSETDIVVSGDYHRQCGVMAKYKAGRDCQE